MLNWQKSVQFFFWRSATYLISFFTDIIKKRGISMKEIVFICRQHLSESDGWNLL